MSTILCLPSLKRFVSHASQTNNAREVYINRLEYPSIFTSIRDQAYTNEMQVVGGCEFELKKQELAKIDNAIKRLPI